MPDIFKALSSNPRRRILNHLAHGSLNAGEIAALFDMTKPSISKHLSILRDAGLVSEQKRGQFVIYSLAEGNLTNSLYGFLSAFCPEARRINRERTRVRRRVPEGEAG
jgi:ArsR family transcriptional regulator, arsenate/arsenite/antimonite-responsive transcriptional repressor